MNFDLENARRDLIAKREAAGADSEIGHRCSNLIEQLEHYQNATGDQRAHLAKSIQRTLDELEGLELETKYGTVIPGIRTPD